MRKLLTSGIVDPSKQQPFLGSSATWMQLAAQDSLYALGYSIVGDSYSPGTGYILAGCSDSGAIIANGYMFFGDEIYEFIGGNYSAYVNVPVVVLLTTNGPADPITYSDGSTGNVHVDRKFTIADQVSGTGLFDLSDAVRVQDTKLRKKTVEIGDWDMDATASINVAHGLDYTKVRGFTAVVRNDFGEIYPIEYSEDITGYSQGRASLGVTLVILDRLPGGVFDSTGFNSTGYNRGWITIDYV